MKFSGKCGMIVELGSIVLPGIGNLHCVLFQKLFVILVPSDGFKPRLEQELGSCQGTFEQVPPVDVGRDNLIRFLGDLQAELDKG